MDKWQRDWNQTTKGKTTKEYFPSVAETENEENNDQLQIHNHDHGTRKQTPIYTALRYLTHRHAYVEKQIRQRTTYSECKLLEKQRDTLRSTSTSEAWPISKHLLATKHYEAFKRLQIKFPLKTSTRRTQNRECNK